MNEYGVQILLNKGLECLLLESREGVEVTGQQRYGTILEVDLQIIGPVFE
jgi:hypothetical protein